MESTYLLYDATGDERYVEAGRKLQERLFQKNRVACGFAGVGDVTTGACGLRVRTPVLREFQGLSGPAIAVPVPSPQESQVMEVSRGLESHLRLRIRASVDCSGVNPTSVVLLYRFCNLLFESQAGCKAA